MSGAADAAHSLGRRQGGGGGIKYSRYGLWRRLSVRRGILTRGRNTRPEDGRLNEGQGAVFARHVGDQVNDVWHQAAHRAQDW
jgi:hypothetical protein